MNCAVCGKTVAVKQCDACKGYYCWRHLNQDRHTCGPPVQAAPQAQGIDAVTGAASRKRDHTSALLKGTADADKLGKAPVVTEKRLKCTASDDDPLGEGVSGQPVDDETLAISVSRQPMAIIYACDEPITFTVFLDDDEEIETCEWFVDGEPKDEKTGDSWQTQFRPSDTVEDRRRDYRISVTVTTRSARRNTSEDILIRVAQQGICGTALPEQSTEGLRAACGALLEEKRDFFREPEGEHIVYAADLAGAEMTSSTTTGQLVTEIKVGPRAFRWDREALTVLLKHELVHCKHFSLVINPTEFWYHICDKSQGLSAEHLRQATEVEAYLTSFEDPAVSYKFLLEAGPIASFLLCYQGTITVLNGEFRHSTRDQCLLYLGQCRARAWAAFPELREEDRYREIDVTQSKYGEDHPLQYPT